MSTQIDLLAEKAAEKLAQGLDRVSEKELLVMVLAAVKNNGGPTWPHWRPRDVAVAIIMILSALGVLGAGAGAATKLVP